MYQSFEQTWKDSCNSSGPLLPLGSIALATLTARIRLYGAKLSASSLLHSRQLSSVIINGFPPLSSLKAANAFEPPNCQQPKLCKTPTPPRREQALFRIVERPKFRVLRVSFFRFFRKLPNRILFQVRGPRERGIGSQESLMRHASWPPRQPGIILFLPFALSLESLSSSFLSCRQKKSRQRGKRVVASLSFVPGSVQENSGYSSPQRVNRIIRNSRFAAFRHSDISAVGCPSNLRPAT